MRSMLTSTADVNAEAVGVGVQDATFHTYFVTVRIEMRALSARAWSMRPLIPLGREGRTRCDERERLGG